MTIVDRYVLKLYIKVFLVCYVSLTGLYVIIETFNNLEEFLELGKAGDGLLQVLADYFIARAFSFFDRASHLIALMSAIFTISWLQKTNELTAIMASGVPQWRVLKPAIAASIVVSLLAMANRELTIPRYRDQLVRNAQSWTGETPQPMQCRVDYENDFFFSGNQVIPIEKRILAPNIHLDQTYPGWGSRINAESAVFVEATEHHPAGYLCQGVTKPRDLAQLPSLRRAAATSSDASGKPPKKRSQKKRSQKTQSQANRPSSGPSEWIVMGPGDQAWLRSNECLIVSRLDFEQLVNGDELLQYANTLELIKNIRNPSQDYGAGLRVTAHARLLRPLLDVSLLLLGLPIVISRGDRNLFVAAGYCVGVIAAFLLATMFFAGLGAYGMLPPYAAAWAPVALFVPLAAVAMGTMNQ